MQPPSSSSSSFSRVSNQKISTTPSVKTNVEFQEKFFYQISLVKARSENLNKSRDEIIGIAVHDYLNGAGPHSDFTTDAATALAGDMLELATTLHAYKIHSPVATAIRIALIAFTNPHNYKKPLDAQIALAAQQCLDESRSCSQVEIQMHNLIHDAGSTHLFRVGVAVVNFLDLPRHAEEAPKNYEANITTLLDLAYRLNLSIRAENKELAYQIWECLSSIATFELENLKSLPDYTKRKMEENSLGDTLLNKAIDYLNGTESIKQDKKQARIFFEQIVKNSYPQSIQYTISALCLEKAEFYIAQIDAENGKLDAFKKLWLCYSMGIGVMPDSKQANFYLHKAADAGCPEAITKLITQYGLILTDSYHKPEGMSQVSKQEAYDRIIKYYKLAEKLKIPGAEADHIKFKETYSKQYGGFFDGWF